LLGGLDAPDLGLGALGDVLHRMGDLTGAATGLHRRGAHLSRRLVDVARRQADAVDELAKLGGRAVVCVVGGDHRLTQVAGEIEHPSHLVAGALGRCAGPAAAGAQLDRQIAVGEGLQARHQLKPHRLGGAGHVQVRQLAVTVQRRHGGERHDDAEDDAHAGDDQGHSRTRATHGDKHCLQDDQLDQHRRQGAEFPLQGDVAICRHGALKPRGAVVRAVIGRGSADLSIGGWA
jgi:hypothetical protein